MTVATAAFADVVSLLNELTHDDPNINTKSPHGTFWQNKSRTQFLAIRTDNWGVPGALVTPGEPLTSNLYLALSGKAPFDGSKLPQMPDTKRYPRARHATAEELAMVAAWITSGCP